MNNILNKIYKRNSTGCPNKNATPHKIIHSCRYICYIIYWMGLPNRQCNFTQLCIISLSKSKWLFQNSTFTNITPKSFCTGFGWSTIVNANTTAWHLLRINPFTTKVSVAKHIYVLNLSICYQKIKITIFFFKY